MNRDEAGNFVTSNGVRVADGLVLVRGGSMGTEALAAAVTRAMAETGRVGMCLRALANPSDHHGLPYSKVCLATPELLEGSGFELEHTQDDDNPLAYTLWCDHLKCDAQHVDNYVSRLQQLFRGPVVSSAPTSEWTSNDIRRFKPVSATG